MIKEFFIRRMIEGQLKQLPSDQREKIVNMFLENPEFFETLAKELRDEMNSGKDQASALQEIMLRHRDELEKVMMIHDIPGR